MNVYTLLFVVGISLFFTHTTATDDIKEEKFSQEAAAEDSNSEVEAFCADYPTQKLCMARYELIHSLYEVESLLSAEIHAGVGYGMEKRKSSYIRLGKRKSSFMRLGKRKSSFMRLG